MAVLSGAGAMMRGMADLYTKNGVPLTLRGDRMYNPSGQNFGYVRTDRVFGLNGRYRGTIVGDRLVYRAPSSTTVSGVRAASARIASAARAPRAEMPPWGDDERPSAALLTVGADAVPLLREALGDASPLVRARAEASLAAREV